MPDEPNNPQPTPDAPAQPTLPQILADAARNAAPGHGDGIWDDPEWQQIADAVLVAYKLAAPRLEVPFNYSAQGGKIITLNQSTPKMIPVSSPTPLGAFLANPVAGWSVQVFANSVQGNLLATVLDVVFTRDGHEDHFTINLVDLAAAIVQQRMFEQQMFERQKRATEAATVEPTVEPEEKPA